MGVALRMAFNKGIRALLHGHSKLCHCHDSVAMSSHVAVFLPSEQWKLSSLAMLEDGLTALQWTEGSDDLRAWRSPKKSHFCNYPISYKWYAIKIGPHVNE